ncbi:hypothetical protein COB57_02205 [Candidatus Peregrinibacteria bacterium]|nr:MAG: hypothetical protein COB57_02205 [Candidatus Peregrinibacteria bacterium]
MKKIVIDIAVLPSQEMMEVIIELNKELLTSNDQLLILGEVVNVPHISLFFGCVDEDALPEIQKIIERESQNFSPIRLEVDQIKTRNSVIGNFHSSLQMSFNEVLSHWQKTLFAELKPYLFYDIDPSMFVPGSHVNSEVMGWIRSHEKRGGDDFLLIPHITIGFGQVKKFEGPSFFTASKIAFYHVGSYCTCNKWLGGVDIT